MKYTIQELTRFIGYVAGVAVGLAFVAYGLVTADLATALAGASTLGVGIVAAPNVSKTAIQEVPEEFEVASALPVEPLAKHAE